MDQMLANLGSLELLFLKFWRSVVIDFTLIFSEVSEFKTAVLSNWKIKRITDSAHLSYCLIFIINVTLDFALGWGLTKFLNLSLADKLFFLSANLRNILVSKVVP